MWKLGGYEFVATRGAEFNHGLGDIVTALLQQGMRIGGLTEHDPTPWPALPKQMDVDRRGEGFDGCYFDCSVADCAVV